MKSAKPKLDAMAISEVQLILAEKRTSLAVMRTGIAVIALPMSVLSVLIATSQYYHIFKVLPLLLPLLLLNLFLIGLGSYLIIRAMLRMRRFDRHIQSIKDKHGAIAKLID